MKMDSWKSSMLEQLKQEMQNIISNFNASNITESEKTIMSQFQFSRTLLSDDGELEPELKDKDLETKETKDKKEKEKDEVSENPLDTLASSFDSEEQYISYPMKRNLVGGVLIGAKNPYVPESIIREEGFEHGDYISVEFSGYKGNKALYNFKLDKKGNGEDDGISVFSYAIVCYDPEINSFYVEENVSGEKIKMDDVPQRLLIPDYMTSKFTLRTGDLIDVSWYGDNVSKFAVSWKHRFDDSKEPEKSEEEKILRYRKQKKEENTPASNQELEKLSTNFRIKSTEDTNLDGLSVTIVGGYKFYASYKKLIEDNGGIVYLIPDDAHLIRMTSAIKKSNLVLIMTEHVSHGDMFAAKERSKKYDVPFKAVRGVGKTNLLQTLVAEKNKILKEMKV